MHNLLVKKINIELNINFLELLNIVGKITMCKQNVLHTLESDNCYCYILLHVYIIY